MPLGSGNITQTNSGSSPSGGSVTVTVPSPTSGGTVIIGLSCADALTSTPAGFVQDANIVEVDHYHFIYRKAASTGETSWTFTTSGGSMYAWWVDEVTGLDPSVPFVTGTTNGTTSSVATISTGTTATVPASDILCYASFGSYNTASTTITWSAETNSFTEIHDTSSTPGTNRVSIAECRRFPGAGGTFESTGTLSASTQASGILVVYQAPAVPATVVDDVSVGGTFGLTALVTSRSSGNTFLDLYTSGTTVQGSIVLVSDLSVTGTMNYGTDVIGVTASSVTFTVGDVVQSDTTGECMVVRDAWTDDGPRWSNTTTRSTIYTTMGWTVIGSASLS